MKEMEILCVNFLLQKMEEAFIQVINLFSIQEV